MNFFNMISTPALEHSKKKKDDSPDSSRDGTPEPSFPPPHPFPSSKPVTTTDNATPFVTPHKSRVVTPLTPSPIHSTTGSHSPDIVLDAVSSCPGTAPTTAPGPRHSSWSQSTLNDLQQGYLGDDSSSPPPSPQPPKTPEDQWRVGALFRETPLSDEQLIDDQVDAYRVTRQGVKTRRTSASSTEPRIKLRRSRIHNSLNFEERAVASESRRRSSFMSKERSSPCTSHYCLDTSSESSPDTSPKSSSYRNQARRPIPLIPVDSSSSPGSSSSTSSPLDGRKTRRRSQNSLVWILCMVGITSVAMIVWTSRSITGSEDHVFEQPIRPHMSQSSSGLRGKIVQSAGRRMKSDDDDGHHHHSHSSSSVTLSKTKHHETKQEVSDKKHSSDHHHRSSKTKKTESHNDDHHHHHEDASTKKQPSSNKKNASTTTTTANKTNDSSASSNHKDAKEKHQHHQSSKEKKDISPVVTPKDKVEHKTDDSTNMSAASLLTAQEETAGLITTEITSRELLKVMLPPKANLSKAKYDQQDPKMFARTGKKSGRKRVVSLDPAFGEHLPSHRRVKQYPADFTDNTQLYSVLDSGDERLNRMEIREPYTQGECVPMQEWQTTFHPECNGVHELGLENLGEDNGNDVDLFGTKGFWRNAWKLDVLGGHDTLESRDTVVLKTLKFQHNFEDAHFEHDRVDAVAMERLTASPHVINVFGFCGHSVVTEYADGSRVGELADKAKKKPLARLKIASDIANGLADVHGIDGDGNATFVHLDVNPANVVSIGGTLKLNDFNIGIIRRWNTTSNTPCGFPAQYPNPQWRSPEEARNEQNLTEKVDIFSMGHIFFRLICGHEPWNKLEPNGRPSKEEVNEKVKKGVLPFIPEHVMNSEDPEVIAIRDEMLKCYSFKPSDRPSARDIARSLQSTLDRLTQEGILTTASKKS